MELLRISETKLKIILTDEDMILYSLSSDAIDYENAETRRALRKILSFAKNKTGFDSEKNRIFIQLYPSKKGGCELYITKLSQENGCENDINNFESEQNNIFPIPAQTYLSKEETEIVFLFSSLEHLISCCREMYHLNYIVCSEAFSSKYETAYFLKLKVNICFYGLKISNILSEFGYQFKNSKLLLESNEYTTLICKNNAVETLGLL